MMPYIIKDYTIRYGRGSTNGVDPWYYIEDEYGYKDIEDVKECYPIDVEVRITDEDYNDLYSYEQNELEEVFNEAPSGYIP
jgi:hypothetical protein